MNKSFYYISNHFCTNEYSNEMEIDIDIQAYESNGVLNYDYEIVCIYDIAMKIERKILDFPVDEINEIKLAAHRLARLYANDICQGFL